MVKLTDSKIEWAVVTMQAVVSGVYRWRFDTAYAFAEWYNKRVPRALDLEHFETPNDAFIWKMSGENGLVQRFQNIMATFI